MMRMANKIRVGIVGGGVIGKRDADGVTAQEDMQLSGVADISDSALISVINMNRGYKLFASSEDARRKMEEAGLKVEGFLNDLLEDSEIVVDCTVKGVPQKNINEYYNKHNIPFIVEGGEEHDLTGRSFSTFPNYEENFRKDRTRVVSCNTTALCRMLSTLDGSYGVLSYHVDLVRRGTDPLNAATKGPSNVIEPVLGGSHHYQDVETCMSGLIGKGYSMAVATSHTLSHVHMLQVDLEKGTSVEEILKLFDATPRMRVVQGKKDGLPDTAKVAEYYRDVGRLRGDHPEITIWGESVIIRGKKLYLIYDVHMESIPIPENIDAIRALRGTVEDKWKSAQMTDSALEKHLPGFTKKGAIYAPADKRLEIIRAN